VAQAQALGRRALVLAESLADAYDAARQALGAVGEAGGDPTLRDLDLGRVVAAAAEPPLALGACAADIALLAAVVAVHGPPDLRANAVVAAKLAAAVADSAAHLVEINLVAGADEEQIGLARRRARAASEAARSAATA
jgi:formiminotetrahydrofolate cyclodeaminase